MPTAQELAYRGQQYRNYEPREFLDAVEDTPGDAAEVDKKLRSALKTVESGRFSPFLEHTSSMFSRLDRDEAELFTRRNPVLVQWMSVFNTISDHNPYQEFYDLADTMLEVQSLTKRTGMEQRSARVIADDVHVPPFERPEIREGRTHLQDMAYRRRSYRNWSPFEFPEIVGDSNIDTRSFEISRGFAEEIGLYDAETIDEIEGWPINADGDVIARTILERVEAGRFEPMLKAGHRFVTPLDPDEMEEWTLQNPGITVWISAYGYMNHGLHSDQLLNMTGIEWPPLGEVTPDEGWAGEGFHGP